MCSSDLLQDWGALGRLALFAALAAAPAWVATHYYLAATVPLVRMAAGGVVLAGAYAVLLAFFGPGREWLTALRAHLHGA